MSGLWSPTIHIENHLNPGVPDLSYVMNGNSNIDCETGWLELKAINDAKSLKFTLEPSQHRWIGAHHTKIPVHLLLSVGDVCYLVSGSDHRKLIESVTHEELLSFVVAAFDRTSMRRILHECLTLLTNRKR